MSENIKKQIIGFVQSRAKKRESTASRHVHIRFAIEISEAEKILDSLTEKHLLKFYDKDYQEDRYKPK